MKISLIVLQVIYAILLFPWFIAWAFSFMVFDYGINVWGFVLVGVLTLYPVAVVLSIILTWVFFKKWKPVRLVWMNLIPAIWVVPFLVVMIFY